METIIVSKYARQFEMAIEADGNTLTFVDPNEAEAIPRYIARQLTSKAVCLDNGWMIYSN